MPQTKNLIIVIILMATSFGSGIFFSQKIKDNFSKENLDIYSKIEKREEGFTFINPLLECEYQISQGNTNLKDLNAATKKIVSQHPEEKISLYYRDLSNGPWYGINENDNFAPQSLLKLPLTISYIKISENSSILNKKILYDKPIESNLKKEQDLELNKEYEVGFLIERVIVLSDNIAFNLLASNISDEYIKKTHDDLGISYPSKDTPEDFISVRSYSSIFRVLYNSSYLYRKNSEYLLNILSQTEFKDGLVAGIPEGITVSHKFGILNKENGDKQLHDCGIIYHPEKPYVLCVMTRGKNLDNLKTIIKEISGTIYQVVDGETK
ncbi:serine hydrolase [Candidatus Woesebacteria bacterium]|nr:serine hydrolase [Candidatus Woesebacteria bacterium]